MKNTDIAVIGMACRFPGANNYQEFWENLAQGRTNIQEIPQNRWDWKTYWGNPHTETNKTDSKWGGFLDHVNTFDAGFFGLSAREAELMDPQQRIILELSWTCFEDAGICPSHLSGEKIGVFIGVANLDYKELQEKEFSPIEAHYATGIAASVIPNRISHAFNFTGPSIPIDTACSSSLCAIHAAIQSLQQEECRMALAGGVSLLLTPLRFICFSKMGILSPTGSCRTFDQDADGTVRGEGAGLILLKPLENALQDGDSIYGILKGSAVNHSGKTHTLSYPNPDAQADVIIESHRRAGISPESISYIEAHGTGTPKGDPIEFQGLFKAFQRVSPHNGQKLKKHSCGIGCVKPQIGHLEAAAGIAGVIKVLLAMKYKQLPGLPNFKRINPQIPIQESPFYIVEHLQEWMPSEGEHHQTFPRRAGVSAFGFGGVNAHVVIEEASFDLRVKPVLSGVENNQKQPIIQPFSLIPLSGKTEEALKRRKQDLKDWLEKEKENYTLADISAALLLGREHFDKREAFVVKDVQELQGKLKAALEKEAVSRSTSESNPVFEELGKMLLKELSSHKQMSAQEYGNKLRVLAELYVKGYDFDWNSFSGKDGRPHVSLPTYPFAQTRYWIDDVNLNLEPRTSNLEPSTSSIQKPIGISLRPLQFQSWEGQEVLSGVSSSALLPEREREFPSWEGQGVGNKGSGLHEMCEPTPNPFQEGNLAASQRKDLLRKSQELLQEELSVSLADALYMNRDEVEREKTFTDMGMDSIIGLEWVQILSKQYGISIAAGRIYDYPTIRTFAEFLAHELNYDETRSIQEPITESQNITEITHSSPPLSPVKRAIRQESIAIVGMSGRYPGASDLSHYWQNLVHATHSIREIPPSRWDITRYYDPRPGQLGKIYCKWLGILDEIEYFDPLFFMISPAEAELMDPQQRLFLQEGYHAFEDAGYSRQVLDNIRCGVYLGLMHNEYGLLLAQHQRGGTNPTGNSAAIAAARLAYHLNLKGPAIALDTACSSSLVATHLACQALEQHEIDMALVSGVNLYLTPESYIGMCGIGMLSPDGQCKTFDNNANGFVPGEGVGAMVLKRLEDAQASHDRIYGVIIASGLNQDGKTNGITAPGVTSQMALVREIYKTYQIEPEHIQYVEMHGTGTKLGDPIELEALASVFQEHTQHKQYCAIGSVKSNIGHTSAAAGVASLHKVLLCLQHETLAPTLHFNTPNEHFDFENSPFYVNTRVRPWETASGIPRRAAVSSFGFSGTNAHLVIEEYLPEPDSVRTPVHIKPDKPLLFVLSAKSHDQLQCYAENMKCFLEAHEDLNLVDMAYTLQIGREAMDCRLACLADSRKTLLKALDEFSRTNSAAGVLTARINKDRHETGIFETDEDAQALLQTWFQTKKLKNIAELWLKGVNINWNRLYGDLTPHRISLPTYPFAKKRYWIDDWSSQQSTINNQQSTIQRLHPLLHKNTSDLSVQRFSSIFTGQEFFLADHIVKGQRVLPGVAYIEMARAAGETADTRKIHKLRNIVWQQPLNVGNTPQEVHISLYPEHDWVNYEVSALAMDNQRVVRSQGTLFYEDSEPVLAKSERVDIDAVKQRCTKNKSRTECYTTFERLGIQYGAGFQPIQDVVCHATEALSRLVLPSHLQDTFDHFVLHPVLMDGALQTIIGFPSNTRHLNLPFSVAEVEIFHPLKRITYAYVKSIGKNRFDIAIVDESGVICVKFHNFALRELASSSQQFCYIPRWTPEPLIQTQSQKIQVNSVKKSLLIIYPQDGAELAKALVELHSADDVVEILLGSTTQRHSENIWEIETRQPNALAACIQEHTTLDRIYFLGGIQTGQLEPDALQTLEQSQEQGVLSLFRLIKALHTHHLTRKPLQLKVISNNVYQIASEKRGNPYAASLFGLSKAIAKEYPNLELSCFDIDLEICQEEQTADHLTHIARTIITEPFDRGGNETVIRAGRRYVRTLYPLALPATQKTPLRQHGTYLIVGGAGGIGLELSRYLAEKVEAQLVLIGRSELCDEQKAKIAQIEAKGGKVLYVQADAASLASLQQAVEKARTHFGKIHGAVHSALVLRDKMLAFMDEDSFRAALAPKVAGSVILQNVLADEALDFMLYFSSAQSFLGNAGQSNYAAACCFQDVFAHYLDGVKPYPVKIINWGYWGSVGIVSSKEYNTHMTSLGIASIEPEEGIEVVQRVLGHPVEQLMAIKAEDHVLEQLGVDLDYHIKLYPHTRPALLERVMAKGNSPPRFPEESLLRLQQAFCELETFSRDVLLNGFRQMGVFQYSDEQYTFTKLRDTLNIIPKYHHLYETLLDMLVRTGVLHKQGDRLLTGKGLETPELQHALNTLEERKAYLLENFPEIHAHVNLLDVCLSQFFEILQGRISATDLIFPHSSMKLVEGIYKGHAPADYFNDLVVWSVRSYVEARLPLLPQDDKIQILEVGAGTGGTSAIVLEALSQHQESIQYVYTDISKALVQYGETEYGQRYAFVEFNTLDIELPPESQGYELGSFDLIIAANVLHATRTLQNTLQNTKALLHTHGWLIVNEATALPDFLTLTFGLLDGWWIFEDPENRLPGSPLLNSEMWRTVLREAGFEQTVVSERLRAEANALFQDVIIAESNGIVKFPQEWQSLSLPFDEVEQSRCFAASAKTSFATPDACRHDKGRLEDTLQAKVEQDLIRVCSELLKVDVAELETEVELFEYGMDSIMMMGMLNRLEEIYGNTFDPNAIAEYPTISCLADYLIQEQIVKPDESGVQNPAKSRFCTPGHFSSRRRLVSEAAPKTGKIAVIGIACRFPDAKDAAIFWQNLAQGKSCIREVPPERWEIAEYYSPAKNDPDTTYSKWGGYIEDIDLFDAAYFGISEGDALVIDPQHRILLERSQELLDSAGYTKGEMSQTNTGIFLGGAESSYVQKNFEKIPAELRKHVIVNTLQNMMAARISNFYDLTGPSQTLDTACSSSLVAIHQACREIHTEQCRMAIAGGVELLLDPFIHIGFSQARVLSDEDRSYIFDRRAKGIVIGEGAGLVLLKAYEHAIEDGDQILGVITGSAVNNDGQTMGLTVPNLEGQKAVIRAAIAQSGVNPGTISLLEAHGTGTLLGDPIEIKAITQVYRDFTQEKQYCAVGSVKSNIGHLLHAAGIASVIKVLLALQYKQIPSTLHCETPHPRFQFEDSPFYPAAKTIEWTPRVDIRRAAISSFGFGGTNCHLILEEFVKTGNRQYIPKRVPLPPTQFHRKRYWLGKDVTEPLSRPEVVFDVAAYRKTFVYDEDMLKDHQIFGEQILLGVVHCSLAIEAAKAKYPDRVLRRMRKINFTDAIRLASAERAEVSVTIEERDGEMRFENTYRISDQPQAKQTAFGELLFEKAADKITHAAIDLQSLRGKASQILLSNDFYVHQNIYGPSLFTLQQVYEIGEDEVLGEIQLTPAMSSQVHAYTIHPAIFDGAYAIINFFPMLETLREHIYIPFFIKDIYLIAPVPEHCYCYCRLVKQTEELLIVDTDYYDQEGHHVMRLEGVSLKRVFSLDVLLDSQASSKTTTDYSSSQLSEHLEHYFLETIKTLFASPAQKPDSKKNFMDLGIDSSQLIQMTQQLEKEFGIELYPTLFFEYQNISALVEYFKTEHRDVFMKYFDLDANESSEKPAISFEKPVISLPESSLSMVKSVEASPKSGLDMPGMISGTFDSPSLVGGVRGGGNEQLQHGTSGRQDIAVIGMAGRLASSQNLEQFWQHLRDGTDLMTEIPANHWDYRPWFDENRATPNKTYSKWGSFLKDVSAFDPLFFGISPKEAVWMDPQLRILHEVIQETIEDAGYGSKIQGTKTGLYLGVCFREYWDEIVRARIPLVDYQHSSSGMSALSGRISYTFDLQGGNIPLDNACASSLTAMHLACNALRMGESEMAFVAGTNLLLSPLHYVYFSRMQALSPTGRCHTFDEKADGYTPGEGVIAVLLKPLKKAIEDQDNIHAVIKGSAINHAGRSNNPTAPNPELQTRLLVDAWENAGIQPEQLTYIEAHGTGTTLGDPIEINALNKAFGKFTQQQTFCAIGSAKAHIGHLEGSAGLAGVVKVILSMKHKHIPAMPKFEQLNPYIKLDGTPFYVNTELEEWEPRAGALRMAGVSSFGLLGHNAHVVIEEYRELKTEHKELRTNEPHIIVLSARNEERLKVYAHKMAHFLKTTEPPIKLTNIAYTLQTGREAMEARLAMVVSAIEDLTEKLMQYCQGKSDIVNVYAGQITGENNNTELLVSGKSGEQFLQAVIEERELNKIAQLWVANVGIDWRGFYPENLPNRISLPTYPFAKERYWIDDWRLTIDDWSSPQSTINPSTGSGHRNHQSTIQRLHPLLHHNTSDMNGLRFSSAFTGQEFFLKDHLVKGQRVLPGVAYLEMTRAAVAQVAGGHPPYSPLEGGMGGVKAQEGIQGGVRIQLKNVVWLRPIIVGEQPVQVHIGLFHKEGCQWSDGEMAFEIYSEEERPPTPSQEGNVTAVPVVHSQGCAIILPEERTVSNIPLVDLSLLQTQDSQRSLNSDQFYEVLCSLGVELGTGLQSIEMMYVGSNHVLAKISLPSPVSDTQNQFVLHPSIMDAAFQGAVGFMMDSDDFRLSLPFGIQKLEIFNNCNSEMWALIRASDDSQAGQKLDIDLCDETGAVCVQIQGFSFRALEEPLTALRPTPHSVNFSSTSKIEDNTFPSLNENTLAAASLAVTEIDTGTLHENIKRMLIRGVSNLLNIKPEAINVDAEMNKYGFDSLTLTELANELNRKYTLQLAPTIFFEYPTISSFANYLLEEYQDVFTAKFRGHIQTEPSVKTPSAETDAREDLAPTRRRSPFVRSVREFPASQPKTSLPEPIAIVGMSGRFPMAQDIHEFWLNLVEGRDCITEIPKNRWAWQSYYGDPATEANKTNIKWGGFIDGVDEFDPLFFGISPREAQLMDPQQRLLMIYVWKALEDAGYSAQSLAGTNTGIFVGTGNSGYNGLLSRANVAIEGYTSTGMVPSVGPNRMSYFLNIHGPSEPVETACSSSLVALHRAVVALEHGSCETAIVGGVNTIVTPELHISFSKAGMLCEDGRCKTFSDQANGYVRGEGVGMLILKPLKAAEHTGDHIYGLIRGTAENHGGRANSLTAPNPKAQADVLKTAYTRARIDPRTVTYIETHGTGTPLGDPIEINGLKTAFNVLYRAADDPQVSNAHCGLGSVKTNIGHLELAAGIAGVIKVLLQLKHHTLVKSLHCNTINPYIDLEDSPFYIVQDTQEWTPLHDAYGNALPRRAGVSSFGFGGANAHIVLEEYIPSGNNQQSTINNQPFDKLRTPQSIIVLSAKNDERLREQAQQLLVAIREQQVSDTDLADMAYTLQVGREAMEERLAMIVYSLKELEDILTSFVNGQDDVESLYRGQAKRHKDALAVFATDEELQGAIDTWIQRKKYAKLLDLWVKGLSLDWNTLYNETTPHRISLPTYPFARERYWIDDLRLSIDDCRSDQSTINPSTGSGHRNQQSTIQRLHPLLHQNTSDLSEQRFSSTFTGQEFFFADHVVQGQAVLPGVAYLEIARAAVALAAGGIDGRTKLRLANVVWMRPVVVKEQAVWIHIRLFPEEGGEITFEVYENGDTGESVIHCQGRVILSTVSEVPPLNIPALQTECNQFRLSASQVYDAFKKMGIDYGPGHQAVEALYVGAEQVLAKLSLPSSVSDTYEQFVLHPSLMDSALQASVGLIMENGDLKPVIPFALENLEIFHPCQSKIWAFIRYSDLSAAGEPVQKLDIDVCDDHGTLCVRMRGLSSRVLEGEVGQKHKAHPRPQPEKTFAASVTSPAPLGTLLLSPVWKEHAIARNNTTPDYAQYLVMLCELDEIEKEQIEYQINGVRVFTFHAHEPYIEKRFRMYAAQIFEEIQYLIKEKSEGKVLIQIVVSTQGEKHLFSGLSGLLNTMRLEQPKCIGQLIEVDGKDDTDRLIEKLRENRCCPHDKYIRYQDGTRYVAGWRELTPQPPLLKREGESALPSPFRRGVGGEVPWRDHGVYLITGGVGGLGMIFAEEIAQHVKAVNLILVGRSPLNEHKQAQLDTLESSGARIDYQQVDVTQQEAVVKLIRHIREEFGTLNGIIHSAGVIRDNFMLNKSTEELQEVLAPKVTGVVNLDRASKDLKLDFFVLFSSIAGVIGNIGQADYATANAFLDAYATYRNRLVAAQQRQGRTLSLNWPLWKEGGMHVNPETEKMMTQNTGMIPMQTSTGIRAFYHSLASGSDQVMVIEGHLPRMKQTLCPLLRMENTSTTSGLTTEIEPGLLLDDIKQMLLQRVSKLLKVNPEDIDDDTDLREYGFDSITLTEFANTLNQEYTLELSPTVFFEHSTLQGFAEYLFQEHQTVLATHIAQHRSPETSGHVREENTQNFPVEGRRHARFSKTATDSVLNEATSAVETIREVHPDKSEHEQDFCTCVPPPRELSTMVVMTCVNLLAKVCWNIKVTGRKHIPAEGPFLLCSNHEAYFDGLWIYMFLPWQMRKNFCTFSKRENYESSFTSYGVNALGGIPIDRDGDPHVVFRIGKAVLKDGRPLLIFPEGTRTHTGEPGAFRRGSAHLALATHTPIIPVRILGGYRVHPWHQRFPNLFDWRHMRRFKIEIRFGAPIDPASVQEVSWDAKMTALTEKIRAAVIALGDESL